MMVIKNIRRRLSTKKGAFLILCFVFGGPSESVGASDPRHNTPEHLFSIENSSKKKITRTLLTAAGITIGSGLIIWLTLEKFKAEKGKNAAVAALKKETQKEKADLQKR